MGTCGRAIAMLYAQYYLRLIRLAFRLLYRELAWSYDTVAWLVSRGLWRRWVLAAVPFLHGRVLELGFGTGHIQLALASRPGPLAVGLDASPQMTAICAGRLRQRGLPVRLLRGLAQQLPFPSAAFDTVLATFPAEYVLAPQTQSELRRVLAPGGRLVIVDGATFQQSGLYERLVDLAYRLTLQASVRRTTPDQGVPGRLAIAGFQLSAHRLIVGPSEVQVIIGHAAER